MNDENGDHELSIIDDIQNKIYTIRGAQVMLDRDLAILYKVETRVLNQAVKRNNDRFPKDFCFQLTDREYENWKSQIVMSNDENLKSQTVTSSDENLKSQFATSSWGGRRTKPYAFTEQGVAMLSAVLRSETAVKTSIQIINAFVNMRRFIFSNAGIFQRLGTLELKQIEADKKVEEILDAIESREIRPKQGIFFDGQIYDAHKFVSDIFRSARESITIIDNYLDDSVLTTTHS